MGKKTKRQQPRPKRKKSKSVLSKGVPTLRDMYKGLGKELKRMLGDKENVNNVIQEHIGQIEGIFRRYDTIQLLGSTGLYLIDNVPNMEKFFLAGIAGKELQLDENAEVIAEYALNYGLSMPNEGKEAPTKEVVNELRE